MTDLSRVRQAVEACTEILHEDREAAARADRERVWEAIRLRKLKAHDNARDEALREAVEGGYFVNDPYSINGAALTEFRAPCGCEGRFQKEWDGDSSWTQFAWTRECDVREELV